MLDDWFSALTILASEHDIVHSLNSDHQLYSRSTLTFLSSLACYLVAIRLQLERYLQFVPRRFYNCVNSLLLLHLQHCSCFRDVVIDQIIGLHCRVTVLGKLFTPIVPLFTKQQNW